MTRRAARTAVGAHYGLRDWLAQRITAVVLLAFLLVLAIELASAGGIDHARWVGVFHPVAMKLLGTLAAAALCFHAWVGMRDIWMDYIKPVGLRLTLHVGTILWLAACFVWSVQIMWSV